MNIKKILKQNSTLKALESSLGLKRHTLRRGVQPEYTLPLDEAEPLPELFPVLGGFSTEFIISLSRPEIKVALKRLIAYPMICRGCGLQLYWGTAPAEIDREKTPKLAPFDYAYCIPCAVYYPLDDMPLMAKLLLTHSIPRDLSVIKQDILEERPKELAP